MKNFLLFALGSSLLLVFSFASCKKKGCTDELAINYFSAVKTDDGSCSYSTSRLAAEYSYLRNKDTVSDTATVFSLEKSHMKIQGGLFDYNKTEFMLLVDWSTKKMAMPDSILPILTFSGSSDKYYGSVVGEIKSKDNFIVTYTQQIPKWNQPSVKKDTVIIYDFKRI